MSDIFERRGRFILSRDKTVFNPEFWGMVMSKMLITRCEHLFNEGFDYSACSPLFREVKDNEIPPRYKIQVDDYNDIIAVEVDDGKSEAL